MRALMERPGTILSRAQIEERIYGWGEEVESNAVDVLIHSLRKRFGKALISNVRGAGWMVRRADDAVAAPDGPGLDDRRDHRASAWRAAVLAYVLALREANRFMDSQLGRSR